MTDNTDAVVYAHNQELEGSLPGIPMRDLTGADVATFDAFELKTIEASPLFTKVTAKAAPKTKAKSASTTSTPIKKGGTD